MDYIELGRLRLDRRGFLIDPNGMRVTVIGDPDWQEIKDALTAAVNFVPFTLFLTILMDQATISPNNPNVIDAVEQSAGVLHFRPNDRETHRASREIVGKLLGLS